MMRMGSILQGRCGSPPGTRGPVRWRRDLVRIAALLVLGLGAVSAPQAIEATAPPAEQPFRVIGYVPTYSLERVPPEAYRRVTDIILFSAELTSAGDYCEESIGALPVAHFQALKRTHGVRVYLCFGGWGRSDGFSEMTRNEDRRAAFIERVLQWCLDHEFDGVDYDWEFPATRDEHTAYGKLLAETVTVFRPHGLRVSVALGHTQTLDQAAYDAVDAIHLMTYDMGVRHATEESAQKSLHRLIRSGAPVGKIVLGIPFYGRLIEDRDVAMGYRDILEQFSPKADEDEAGGFYFNNIETIQRKTRYSLEHGLAGVMIWELGMDTEGGSLTAAIHELQEDQR